MLKKFVVLSLALAVLITVADVLHTQTAQPAAGYTGAPGDLGTCANVACHNTIPDPASSFLTFELFNDTSTKYQTNTPYTFLINNSNFGKSVYGFQVTALDDNGDKAGSFSIINTNGTAITTQASREYIGHKNANGTVAWLFTWQSPAVCVGNVTFYVASVAADGNGQATNDEVYLLELVFPPLVACSNLNADFTASPQNTCVGETVTFTDASAGSGIISWDWDFGVGANPATASGQGPHNVTYSTSGQKNVALIVDDGTDTSGTAKLNYITVNPAATANAGNDLAMCFGDSIKLLASGGVTYLWSPAGSLNDPTLVSPTASPTITTTYTVTVTDANGCTAEDDMVLTVNPLPTPTVQGGIICAGGSFTLDAGAGYQSYAWSTTDNTQTTTVTTAGTYTVTVTDFNNCTASTSAVVTQGSNLLINLNDTMICQGETLVLDAGNPGATYLWSTNDTSRTITVTTSGTYYVDVDNGACSGTDTAVVVVKPVTQAIAGNNVSVCAGDSVAIGDGAGPANPVFGVSWMPTTGLSDPGAVYPNASPATTTEYIVTYADTNGCVNADSVTVMVDQAPTVSFSNLAGPYCANDQFNVLLAGLPAGGYFQGPGIRLIGGIPASRLYSNGPDSIPDNNIAGINVPFTIGGLSGNALGQNISLQSVCFEITHSRVGDLFVELVSPSGVRVTLVDRPGTTASGQGCVENNMQVCVGLGTGNELENVCNVGGSFAITGTYTAHTGHNLNDINDGTTNPNGTWTLFISDNNSGDVGRLEEFQLNFGRGGTPAFNPSLAGVGSHDITYTYTNAGGCSGTATQVAVVNPLPAVAITGLGYTYCEGDAADTVIVSPAGGTLAGPGINGANFDPAAAGVGMHEVWYAYTDGAGCTDTAFRTVTVLPVSSASFTGLGGPYCSIDNVEDTLVGTPAGGAFSGPGVSGNIFNPSLAGAGLHDIVYTYTPPASYVVDTNCAYGPVSGFLTSIALTDADEGLSGAVPIPFTFNFFGLDYDFLQVSSNGFITFDITNTDADGTNDALPSANGVNNLIAGMWDNLVTNSVGYVVDGTAPNRRFVVHFSDAYQFNTPSEVVNFQIILHETTNVIEIQCIECQLDASSASATQGIENIDASDAVVVMGRNDAAWDAFTSCVTFTPSLCPGQAVQQVLVTGINLGPDVTLCIGDTVELFATGGVAPFIWSTGDTTFSIKVNPTDTTEYFVSSLDSANCATFDTVLVKVVQPTQLSIANLAPTYCTNRLPFTLVGVPTGGNFSGMGVSNNILDISSVPVGGPYTVTYDGLDTNGCVSSTSAMYSVLTAPSSTLNGVDSQYCADAPDVFMSGIPAGGVFGGPGVSNNKFVPFFAGPGVHIITYGVLDPSNGCVGFDTAMVRVDTVPVVSFTGLDTAYCSEDVPAPLVGSPAGGVFSGTGVSSASFDPALAGVGGPHTVKYTYTDGNGCSDLDEQNTFVRPVPGLAFVGLKGKYCTNVTAFALNAIPTGGTFFGNGVSGGMFDPAAAGVGVHGVSYTFANVFGCVDTITRMVTIFNAPTVAFSGLEAQYCQNDPIDFLTGSPAGGAFSGLGIAGNTYSPSLAGTGNWDISYSYTDANGCSETAVQSTIVNSVPIPSIGGLDSKYCPADAAVVVQVAPPGGELTGAGIMDSIFNPARSGYGVHGIIYSVTNGAGCTGTARVDVQVDFCPGIEPVAEAKEVFLFPNPTTGLLNVKLTGFTENEIQLDVFDLKGKRVYYTEVSQPGVSANVQLNLEALSAGMYYVRINSATTQVIRKVIIE